MSLHRRNPRRDIAESPIVSVLLKAGFAVQRISAKDVPDLLIGRNGITRQVEIKTGKAPVQPGQVTWALDWRGAPVIYLRTIEDTIRMIRAWPNL